ncbi:NAD-dependent epimerase/dehydratase family protein [Aureimonas fodinaquatilis]|uniref:NAD-dependent epimerase/dehydratase family protein n=1 Tax=Aureimonas fodinaquatilis TaxID=2565783 RepID=A0A5B0DQD0_9HYPH|nr:NAD-dependent epimerase/dehydratase family protein [Aureimonas fodinaquatilis]KAA0969007.1 NAD-dependent epimerase/dehydratase family protein [Aureimonas fodinaquatilis]
MRVLITGCAGFIGFHLARRMLADGHVICGIDSLSAYYDVGLKRRRLALLQKAESFEFLHQDIADKPALDEAFKRFAPEIVVHLAAQAGVRHSITHPQDYVSANICGTFNLLEACRAFPVRHLMLASTSSVYGANPDMPYQETASVMQPLTLYAASKGAGELMAHSYSHLFKIPMTAIRFFTVYGPWGRPDMAYYIFTRQILAGQPIDINNNGQSSRDFTYIDDLVETLCRLTVVTPDGVAVDGDTLSPVAPYRVVNAGGGQPMPLLDFVREIEKATGKTAIRQMRPLPAGDATGTFASSALLQRLVGYKPQTPISIGIPRFVDWYRREIETI